MNTVDNQSSLQDFILFVVKSIVSHPEEVIVDRNMNSYDEAYTIQVHSEDMGVLIGKKGKNINAIRNLVSIKSSPNRAYIQIVEQAADQNESVN